MNRKQMQSLSAEAGRFRTLATWVMLSAALILLLEHFGIYAVPSTWRPDAWRNILVSLIVLTPQAVYLWGLWSVRQAFDAIAKGRFFDEALTRALSRVGWALIVGAIISVFFIANLVRLVLQTRGPFLDFDLSAIVLGVVGGALLLISRLLAQSRAMKAELDEMI